MGRDKRTGLLQIAGYTAFGVIALALVQSDLFNTLPGTQVALSNYANTGSYVTGIFTGILIFSAEILKILVIVGVVLGSVAVLKNFSLDKKLFSCAPLQRDSGCYRCPECGNSLSEEFKYCPNCKTPLKHKCSCGKEVLENWKCCPHCGKTQD
jgi:hypothetical protein